MAVTSTRRIRLTNVYDFDALTNSYRPAVRVMTVTNGYLVASGFKIGQLSELGHTGSGLPTQYFRAYTHSEPTQFQWPPEGTLYYPRLVTTNLGLFAWKYSLEDVLQSFSDYTPDLSSREYKPATRIEFARNPDVASPYYAGYYVITAISEASAGPPFPARLYGATGEAVFGGTTNANGYAQFQLGGAVLLSDNEAHTAFAETLLTDVTIRLTGETTETFGYGAEYRVSEDGFWFG